MWKMPESIELEIIVTMFFRAMKILRIPKWKSNSTDLHFLKFIIAVKNLSEKFWRSK